MLTRERQYDSSSSQTLSWNAASLSITVLFFPLDFPGKRSGSCRLGHTAIKMRPLILICKPELRLGTPLFITDGKEAGTLAKM